MFRHPSGTDKRNNLLITAAVLQFILLAVLFLRSHDGLFELLFKYRTVDAVLMFHALFPSFIVSSVWIHQIMMHKGAFFGMMTADVVLSNLATAVVLSVLYVRTSSVTATRLTDNVSENA
jgi:hypothetical protein